MAFGVDAGGGRRFVRGMERAEADREVKRSQHRIVSAALGNERSLWVERPADAGNAGAAPVEHLLIVLDAELYRGGVGAPRILDELREGNEIGRTAVVYVSHIDDETRARECPCHEPFATFVAEELMAWWAETFPAMAKPRRRVIAGLSYTGLAAAYVAWRCPAAFDRVIAQSGSFWWNDGWFVQAVADSRGKSATQYYLDVGRREISTNITHGIGAYQGMSQIEGVERLRELLERRGQLGRHVVFDGGHDFRAWAKTLPDALRWALGDGKREVRSKK